MTEKLGHFFVSDPLPEADRMHRPARPDDGMHTQGPEHCPG
ncbi:hypothetical protein [Nocardia sp. NBC_00403]